MTMTTDATIFALMIERGFYDGIRGSKAYMCPALEEAARLGVISEEDRVRLIDVLDQYCDCLRNLDHAYAKGGEAHAHAAHSLKVALDLNSIPSTPADLLKIYGDWDNRPHKLEHEAYVREYAAAKKAEDGRTIEKATAFGRAVLNMGLGYVNGRDVPSELHQTIKGTQWQAARKDGLIQIYWGAVVVVDLYFCADKGRLVRVIPTSGLAFVTGETARRVASQVAAVLGASVSYGADGVDVNGTKYAVRGAASKAVSHAN